MLRKIKNAPLCRGASVIVKLTVPIILFEIAYIFFFTRGMSAYELTANGEMIMKMIEDTMSSVALSLGGALFFDLYYRKNAADG